VALADTPRPSLAASAPVLRLGRLAGLVYGLAGVAIMVVFWPVFGVFLSNAPRLSSPWLERSADVGLGVANPFLAGAIDLALIAAFGLQHSLMARPGLKRRWRALVPPALERATYVHAANIVLLALVAFWQPIPIDVWRVEGSLLRDACWALFALGWIILLAGAVSFGIAELLGVRQVLDWYWEREPRPLPLKTEGLYHWLRHPMYVGVLLAVWATTYMTLGHGLLAAGLTVYVLIAKRYEERDLNRTYGRLYQAWTRAR
jgi:protein-S-isoprenylcysteine O-methyltransferase Ste14